MLADNLKIARIKKKFTQEELALMLNKTKNVISNWERGDNKPDIESLFQLCEILDVDANYLLGYNNQHSLTLSPIEKELIQKFRILDEYGKVAVKTTLDHEINRVQSMSQPFTIREEAYHYLTQTQTFAMGGFDPEELDEDELIELANELYRVKNKK